MFQDELATAGAALACPGRTQEVETRATDPGYDPSS